MTSDLSLPLHIFAKAASCPSADVLLTFSKSSLVTAQTQLVVAHLNHCDFCRAELQLLKKFPCKPEVVAVVEMPQSLRLFAESILGNCQKIPSSRSLKSPRGLNH
jgi:hypothetical protein